MLRSIKATFTLEIYLSIALFHRLLPLKRSSSSACWMFWGTVMPNFIPIFTDLLVLSLDTIRSLVLSHHAKARFLSKFLDMAYLATCKGLNSLMSFSCIQEQVPSIHWICNPHPALVSFCRRTPLTLQNPLEMCTESSVVQWFTLP